MEKNNNSPKNIVTMSHFSVRKSTAFPRLTTLTGTETAVSRSNSGSDRPTVFQDEETIVSRGKCTMAIIGRLTAFGERTRMSWSFVPIVVTSARVTRDSSGNSAYAIKCCTRPAPTLAQQHDTLSNLEEKSSVAATRVSGNSPGINVHKSDSYAIECCTRPAPMLVQQHVTSSNLEEKPSSPCRIWHEPIIINDDLKNNQAILLNDHETEPMTHGGRPLNQGDGKKAIVPTNNRSRKRSFRHQCAERDFTFMRICLAPTDTAIFEEATTKNSFKTTTPDDKIGPTEDTKTKNSKRKKADTKRTGLSINPISSTSYQEPSKLEKLHCIRDDRKPRKLSESLKREPFTEGNSLRAALTSYGWYTQSRPPNVGP